MPSNNAADLPADGKWSAKIFARNRTAFGPS